MLASATRSGLAMAFFISILAGCSISTRPEGESCDSIRMWSEARLVTMLPSAYWKVRHDAARELALRGHEETSLPALRRAACDCRAEVRVWALAAVWRISGDTDLAPCGLVDALSSCDYEVRLEAAEAIRLLGPAARNAVHALTHLAHDEHHPLRRAACLALAAIGPEAREAVPFLVGLLDDPFPAVSISAMHALGEIGSVESKEALARTSQQPPVWKAELSRRALPAAEVPVR